MIAFLTVNNGCALTIMLCGVVLIGASVLMGKPPQ